jgi:hypothetical protein
LERLLETGLLGLTKTSSNITLGTLEHIGTTHSTLYFDSPAIWEVEVPRSLVT